jgi:Arc/MetJ family transcription regulator
MVDIGFDTLLIHSTCMELGTGRDDRTLIDTSDELLERARAVLGTGAKKDTVNAALAQVVALSARREFLGDARHGALADAADAVVMGQAWRLDSPARNRGQR